MTWWLWILFWCLFWAIAGAYLLWRAWRLWPHARDFGRACTQAMERVEQVRSGAGHAVVRTSSAELTRPDTDDLAWNTPASEWRARRRAARARRRDLRLDDHTQVWAGWHDPLD